ncbi:hypothetical protein IOCL1545_000212600 [Leishmania shawi]|uniref:Uncharacterized protein n=1 Tax=Leishmania shawi TaxID=5680 RepID=A0ABR3EC71_9TRYP
MVCVKTIKQSRLLARALESLSTVRDCLARLYTLDLLQPHRTAIASVDDRCFRVCMIMQVLSGETEAADLSECHSGFVAQLQLSAAEQQKVEVHVQQLPS